MLHRDRPARAVRWAALTILAVATASVAGCGGSDDSGATSTAAPAVQVTLPTGTLPASRQKQIDAVAKTILDAGASAGYVGVWEPGKGAYTVAVGKAAPGRPATVDDNWRIGSITKTFTATAVLQLVDEGKLALDDTIADVDPDLAERFPPFADLTIRQLLDMHSGVGDYLNSPKGIAKDIAADPSRVWTLDELIAAGIATGVTKPGTPGYSTTNYIVLQEIVEGLTGTPLDQVIADRISGPLGLKVTTLPPPDDSAISEPSTTGSVNGLCALELSADGAEGVDAGADVTDWSVSSGAGGGAMQSNLTELATWAASGSGNALLSDATAAERLATKLVQEGLLYGLGIMRAGPFVGHEGEEFGWEAWAIADPGTGRTVVLAGNACGIGAQLIKGAQTIFPDAVLGAEG